MDGSNNVSSRPVMTSTRQMLLPLSLPWPSTDLSQPTTPRSTRHSAPFTCQSTNNITLDTPATFRASRRRREMYIGHARLRVCLSLAAFPLYCADPCNFGNGRGAQALVVHYWADLQSAHGFRCYDNMHVCKLIVLMTDEEFYSAPQCSHCKRCTSYGNSVRLSVCHTPVLCQNDGT